MPNWNRLREQSMSSKIFESRKLSKAEIKFRNAFERLKKNKPELLPKGTSLSQNNVAKEAGVDPSALRRSRYPELVHEIQKWLEAHKEVKTERSQRQVMLGQRSNNRDLRKRIEALTAQRDNALSRVLEAEYLIIQLNLENKSLKSRLPPIDISRFNDSNF